MLDDKVIYTENASNFPFHRTVCLDLSSNFDEKPSQTGLREATQKYIKENKIGIPKISIDIDFVDLSKLDEFNHISNHPSIECYDEVTVIFPELGINTTSYVTETEYDVLKERYNSVHVGEINEDTLIGHVKTINGDLSRLQYDSNARVASSGKMITGGGGGYITLHINQTTDKPDEIYIADTDWISQATKLIRINQNGIGFAKKSHGDTRNILDIDPKSAWSIDGVFNADFIQAGTINADYIKAGTLDAKTLRNNGGDVEHMNADNVSTGTLPNARLGGETRSDITVVNWNGKLLHYYLDHGITKEDSYWLEDDSGWESVYSERH